MVTLALVAALASGPADTIPRDSAKVTVVVPQRRKATEVSDWYARRLMVHKIGAFVELPVFAAQYAVGQRLYTRTSSGESGLSDVHGALAFTTGVLFTSNTITGLWNLWETRAEPKGRTRRIIHSALMLAADAGFVATAALADDDSPSSSGARRHRQVAIGSISLATASTVMMWLWRD